MLHPLDTLRAYLLNLKEVDGMEILVNALVWGWLVSLVWIGVTTPVKAEQGSTLGE